MEIFSMPKIPEKRPEGRRPKHSESYRAMVAKRILDEGMSYREAAKNFGREKIRLERVKQGNFVK